MQLCLKQKIFQIWLIHISNLHQILNIFKKKKIIFIATLFRKLQNVKGKVRPLSEKHCFTTPFVSQQGKMCQTLPKGP